MLDKQCEWCGDKFSFPAQQNWHICKRCHNLWVLITYDSNFDDGWRYYVQYEPIISYQFSCGHTEQITHTLEVEKLYVCSKCHDIQMKQQVIAEIKRIRAKELQVR